MTRCDISNLYKYLLSHSVLPSISSILTLDTYPPLQETLHSKQNVLCVSSSSSQTLAFMVPIQMIFEIDSSFLAYSWQVDPDNYHVYGQEVIENEVQQTSSTFCPNELVRCNQLQETFLDILLQITLVCMQNSSPFDLVTELSSSTWSNIIDPVRSRVYETRRASFYYIVFDNIHFDSQLNPSACLAVNLSQCIYIIQVYSFSVPLWFSGVYIGIDESQAIPSVNQFDMNLHSNIIEVTNGISPYSFELIVERNGGFSM